MTLSFMAQKVQNDLRIKLGIGWLVVEQKLTLGGNKQALYDKLLAQLEADRRVGLSSWFFAAAMANLRPQNLPLSAIYCKFHYFS